MILTQEEVVRWRTLVETNRLETLAEEQKARVRDSIGIDDDRCRGNRFQAFLADRICCIKQK